MIRQNGISVEDMLKLEVMNRCKLIAGFKGIRNTVSRVNIVADPDIFNWVRSGEFLLTTAYFFKDGDIKSQKEFIKEASNKKLAGIGIKVIPYLQSLPDEVLDYAEKLSFPIVDIHHTVPLSDIVISVLKEVFNKQTLLLERIEKVHERFMEAMLEGKSIEEVVEIVSQNVRNPVILHLKIKDKYFQQMDFLDNKTKEEIWQDVNSFYNAKDGKSITKRLYEDKVLINNKYVNRMVMPIVLKNGVYGHLFAWSTRTPLGGFDLSVMESAASIIALSVLQQLMVMEVEIGHKSEFFEDLISPDMKKKKKALGRAQFFNLNPTDDYIVEVINFKDEVLKESNKHQLEHLKDNIKFSVLAIEDIMGYMNFRGVVSTKLNEIQILLVKDTNADFNKRLNQFNNTLVKVLEDRFKEMDIKIGIGRAYKGLDNVNKSFSDATKAVQTGRKLTKKKVINFDELGIYKILSHDFLLKELEEFYNSTLKELVNYDRKKSTELVKTLEAYFKYNGNLTRMAEHLFTHYNTILYRINRIQEITGVNLEDPNDRLNMEIALKIKKIL